MKNNLWISIPLSVLCAGLTANAASQTPTTTRRVVVRPAQTAAPAPTQGSSTAKAPTAPAPTATTVAPRPQTKPLKAKAAATSTVKAPAKKEEPPPTTSFGFVFDTNYSLQASTQADGTRTQGQDFTVIPSVKYGKYKADVAVTYEQDLVDSAASPGFYDPGFGFYRSAWEPNSYVKISPSMSLILPMTDNSKNNVGLIYNIGGALSFSLNTKTLGWDNWSMSYVPSYTRNFTNYDTKLKDGSPNTMYRIRNRFNVGYSFTDKLSLATRFQFDSNYSVSGIVRNSFLHFQSLGYAINDTVEVNITHTNSNSLYKSQTYESNLKFYDDTSSIYSVGMTVVL